MKQTGNCTGSIIKDKNLYTISKIGRLKKKRKLSNPKFELPEVCITKKNLTELQNYAFISQNWFRYLINLNLMKHKI